MVTGGVATAAELTQSSEDAGKQLLHYDAHFEESSAPPLEQAQPPPVQPMHDSVAVMSVVETTLRMTEQILASAPPIPVSDPISAVVSHYGESYNGLPLGCGYGVYRSEDETIVAVSPALYGEMPCGTLIEVCGPGGCVVGARKDACPGCSANVFDLSEAGFYAVCGLPSGVCSAEVRAVEACAVPRLARAPEPEHEEEPEEPEKTVLQAVFRTISLEPNDYEPLSVLKATQPPVKRAEAVEETGSLQAERPCERQ